MKINTFEMTENQESRIIDDVCATKNGVVVFDGPSGSGKTWLLNKMLKKSKKAIKFSYEKIVDMYIAKLQESKSVEVANESMAKFLSGYEIVGIEEIDWISGKLLMQDAIIEAVKKASENTLVIFTGICIKERVPYIFEKLKEIKMIFFETKVE